MILKVQMFWHEKIPLELHTVTATDKKAIFLKSLYFHIYVFYQWDLDVWPGGGWEKKEKLENMPKCWRSEGLSGTPDLDVLIIWNNSPPKV